MNSRLEELYKIIFDAQAEIEVIRATCSHKDSHLGNYSWAPGHIHSGYICNECHYFLGDLKTYEEWFKQLYWEGQDPLEVLKRDTLKRNTSINVYGEKLITHRDFMDLVEKYL